MTKICVCCEAGDEMVPFEGETHRINYRGRTVDVDGLSGFRCPACGEIEFDAASAERYADAGDALVMTERRAT
jgi:HTH-type transcriptional regulator/antitoxin MqsA